MKNSQIATQLAPPFAEVQLSMGPCADSESQVVGHGRMNHQFKRVSVTQSNGREVTHIARGQTTNAERLGERHDRTIDEAKAEIPEASVHIHRTRKLTDGWRRVRERATSEILHERVHRSALVAQEVVDLGEHQTRNIASACLVNGLAKPLVVGRALYHVVDEGPGVANERRPATGRH